MMTHVSFSLVLDHLLTFFSCEKPPFSFFYAVDLQTDACKNYISFVHKKTVETLTHNSLTNNFLWSTIRYLKLNGNLIRIQHPYTVWFVSSSRGRSSIFRGKMNWSTLLFLEMMFHLGRDSWWCVCCCQWLSEVEWHQACRGDCQHGVGITKSYVFLSFAAPSGASTAAQDWNTHRYIREKKLFHKMFGHRKWKMLLLPLSCIAHYI